MVDIDAGARWTISVYWFHHYPEAVIIAELGLN